MIDLSTTSYCKDNKCDNGLNPIFMILILLFLCGGDNGMLGCFGGNNSCGSNNGLSSMLPLLLLLFIPGGLF